MEKIVPIIIPSLEPDKRLLRLLEGLTGMGMKQIVIVNDGSGKEFDSYFKSAREVYGCTVLEHSVNMGKGRALKDAFVYCLREYPDAPGCVTADSDGQHSPKDIKRCMDALLENGENLILGCRDFEQENVPAKSKIGNKLTRRIFKWLCGIGITDTQTGLRAIPRNFMEHLIHVAGERFEFETNMLIETVGKCGIREIAIDTVYDSKENHATHFDPIRDSIRIYRILGKMLIKVILGRKRE